MVLSPISNSIWITTFFSLFFELCLDAFSRGSCFALKPESDVCDLRVVVVAQLVPGGTLIMVLLGVLIMSGLLATPSNTDYSLVI